MNNILVRSITGAVFISLVLFPLFWSKEFTTLVFAFFMVIGLVEFYRFFNERTIVDVRWEFGLAYGLIFYGIITFMYLGYLPFIALLLLLPLFFILLLTELWRNKENPLLNGAVYMLGTVYIAVPFVLFTTFHIADTNNFPLLAGMFLLIWMNDTFAFLSGKFFGRTKLFERISPKKTWEGMIGGLVFTVLAGIAINYLFDEGNLTYWIVTALIIAPVAILGDLLESLFKRNMKVKDSGKILPGHGGILDRFDAALFAIPVFTAWTYFYMYF